jgi:tRNA (guanine-N7-)-methyltransferase
MAKAKMKKLSEVSTFPFVFENKNFLAPGLSNYKSEAIDLKGKWNELVFLNSNPIILELACGKADYTISLAQKFPNINFIGVDIKGDRIWKGAHRVVEHQLKNVAFLRTKIDQIDLFLGADEVSEIWITFPDPFQKKGDINKRLSYSNFLEKYKKITKDNGLFHFKTDAIDLFDFTEESIKDFGWELTRVERDIYGTNVADEITSIKTFYEMMHLADGRKINYLQAIISK